MRKLYRWLRYDLPLHFILVLTNWLPNSLIIIKFRGAIARPFFKKCGKRLQIQRNVSIYNPSEITLGNNVIIPYGCWLTAAGKDGITIEDNVGLAPYVVIVSGGYDLNISGNTPNSAPILLKQGCWIGAHSTIVSNITVGEHAVVAANTLVNSNVPPKCLYSGNPGKKICKLFD